MLAKHNAHFVFFIFCILQRALFLENDSEMEVAHSVAATAGDTEVFYLLVVNFKATVNWIGGFQYELVVI